MKEFLVKWTTEKSSGSRVIEAEQQNDALMTVANANFVRRPSGFYLL